MYPLKKGTFAQQAHVGIPEGTFEEEHGRKGFYGKSAHLYHTHPPTGWIRFEGKLRPHCFDLNKIEPGDLRDPEGLPQAVLGNDDGAETHALVRFGQDPCSASRVALITRRRSATKVPRMVWR